LNRPEAVPQSAQAAWAATRERGALFMMWLMFHTVKLLSGPLAMPFVYLSTAYFFVFSARARAASRDYLARVLAAAPDCGLDAGLLSVYRHFLSFARTIVDKQDAWLGRIDYSKVGYDNHAAMRVMAQGSRGVLLIGSHLGNLELCRALATLNRRVRLNILVHTRHSRSFNHVLRLAGATQVQLLQVTELSAATALMLKSRIDQGEWVVIAGDRVPVHGGRTVDVQLLGGAAAVPVGPYVLASVLECPVHLLFCLRRPAGYQVFFEPFCTQVRWQRSQRDAIIADLAQRFAARLEHYLLMEPLQWFNFYPFWRGDRAARDSRSSA
jgi:predicted LPLAT superfamily acyltransferase